MQSCRGLTTLLHRAPSRVLLLGCITALLATWQVQPARAQVGFGAVGGVFIDPEGMLRESSSLAPDELRKRLGKGGTGEPSERVSAVSPLRKISLRRLEMAVAQ